MSKLLLLGWDAADWQIITPLLQAGRMPNLSRLMANGCYGNIKTLDPPLSPILWTSIATGKRAYDHGILHFMRPDMEREQLIPYRNSDRKVKAIWEILSHQHKWSNVVGWWPGFPVDEINGCMVSDAFFEVNTDTPAKESFVDGLVYPSVHFSVLQSMIAAPSDISDEFIKELLPAFEAQPFLMPFIHNLKKILAHMISVHRVSTWLMQFRPWDFHAVYFETIDKVCHHFIQFAPPQKNSVSPVVYNVLKDVVDAVYCWHDRMLGEYMALAGSESTILLMSDHGFVSGKQRFNKVPDSFAPAALFHRSQGVCVWSGNGIQKGKEIWGMSLLDICPTILHHFRQPVGKDMPGRVLTEVFSEDIPPVFIDSYESVPPARVFREATPNERFDEIALRQMQDLGYVEHRKDFSYAIENIGSEQRFNLATSMIEGDRLEEAFEILTSLVSSFPSSSKFIIALFNLSLRLRKFDIAEGAIEMLAQNKTKRYNLDVLRGDLYFYKRAFAAALKFYQEALVADPSSHYLHLMMGNCLLKLNEYTKAMSSLIKSLSLRDTNGQAYYLLAIAAFKVGEVDQCMGYCMEALANNFSLPALHMLLGRAAFQSGEYKIAAGAFENVLKVLPGKKLIRRMLIEIYKEHLPDAAKYQYHLEKSGEVDNHPIIIVTGLPRSGTSLMMQLLQAGGVQILTDGVRHPDDHNPKGYFEFEKVKRMAFDVSWMKEATGKAVKIVAPLLQYLPMHYTYKIIYMHRDISEILASQQKMIVSEKGEFVGRAYNLILAESYRKLEQAILSKEWTNGSELLKIEFSDIVNGQQEEMEKLEDFLGVELDISKLAAIPDPSLYRNKL